MLSRRFLTATLVALAGCGGGLSRGAVKGKVTVNGELLKAGDIAFVGATAGGPSAGAAGTDGHYHLGADKGPAARGSQGQIRPFPRSGKTTWIWMGDYAS